MPPPIPHGLLPGDQIDYVEQSSITNVTSTVEATPTDMLVGNPYIYDGATRVKFEFYVTVVELHSGNSLVAKLWEDTTDLGYVADWSNPSGGTMDQPWYGVHYLTPSAGKHTYKLTATKIGANTVSWYGGSYFPFFMRITRA